MLTILFHLLLAVTLGHTKPISTNTSLPPHAFANYPPCVDGVPLINCIHPHLGTVYGPTAGHAIYHPHPKAHVDDVHTEATEISAATLAHDNHHNKKDDVTGQLSKRHDYFLDCGKREATNWCQGPPHSYFCDSRGHRRHAGYDESCEYCDCRKISSVSGGVHKCTSMNCFGLGGSPVKEVVGDGVVKDTNGTVTVIEDGGDGGGGGGNGATVVSGADADADADGSENEAGEA